MNWSVTFRMLSRSYLLNLEQRQGLDMVRGYGSRSGSGSRIGNRTELARSRGCEVARSWIGLVLNWSVGRNLDVIGRLRSRLVLQLSKDRTRLVLWLVDWRLDKLKDQKVDRSCTLICSIGWSVEKRIVCFVRICRPVARRLGGYSNTEPVCERDLFFDCRKMDKTCTWSLGRILNRFRWFVGWKLSATGLVLCSNWSVWCGGTAVQWVQSQIWVGELSIRVRSRQDLVFYRSIVWLDTQ